MKKREIDKFIIYNQDYNVLTFEHSNTHKITLPMFVTIGSDTQNLNDFFDKIFVMLSIDRNCFLISNVEKINCFSCINTKLEKDVMETTRNYYGCYKQFTQSDYEQIASLSTEYGLTPHMIPLSSFVELLSSTHDFDKLCIPAIEELEQKLCYKKY